MNNGGDLPTPSERGTSNRMTGNRIGGQVPTRQPDVKSAMPKDTDTKTTGISKEFNWLEELNNHRETKRYIEVKYTGLGMIGNPPNRTEWGKQIWLYVQGQKPQQSLLPPPKVLGSCVGTAFKRVCAGYKAARGSDLLENLGETEVIKALVIAFTTNGSKFPEIWKQHMKIPYPKFLQNKTGGFVLQMPKGRYYFKDAKGKIQYIPKWFGTGIPGALEFLGKAKVVGNKEIWAGELEPGSPMQAWPTRFLAIGHAAIFERYVHNKDGAIVAFVLSDQRLDYHMVRKPGSWKFMFGAKLQ